MPIDTNLSEIKQVETYTTFKLLNNKRPKNRIPRLTTFLLIVLIGSFFLPWTQNIQGKGNVTTLKPEQRPQTIHSTIAGRIEKWYVGEGDLVRKGDTIVFLSEVKDDYFDPELINNTKSQVTSKGQSIDAYMAKASALDNQMAALQAGLKFKLLQANNKVNQAKVKLNTDSAEFIAAQNNFTIAEQQYLRQKELFNKGLKSLTDLEGKSLKYQETLAKQQSALNKLNISQNELVNAKIELSSLQADYSDKLSKSQSEKMSTISNAYDSEASLSKLKNQLSNYNIRQTMYYVLAPQDCYITKAVKYGLGEIVKEGTPIVTIMPKEHDLAVEMYIKPVDLPLIKKGQRIRVQFDGWPALIFSGWEHLSTGTFGGRVVAIDNMISANNYYRLLISPDPKEPEWPKELRVGSGANSIALLTDVKLGYELWRQLNGFPPEYYKNLPKQDKEKSNNEK
jgi:adhesin transport system membrane fusion protein